MELYAAHKQWASRPEDERYTSLAALYAAAKGHFDAARERANVPLSTLRVEAAGDDVLLVGKGGIGAQLTNWAFKQLAARISAPASYLQTLPATLAAQNINHGLTERLKAAAGDAAVNLLLHIKDGYAVRALTSDRYERIWNYEIAERLLDMEAQGWAPAKPDVRVIDQRLPLYASDHDLFAFLAHNDRVIKEPGNPAGLKRGVIVINSEVGAASLKLLRFLYREMCGNHIIWGAEDVVELSLVHRGNIRQRLGAWDTEIKRYLDASASDDEARIAAAQRKVIAGTKDEVLDALFGAKLGLSRKALDASYAAVITDEDGSPRTVWGMAQGITRYSQTVGYADERTALDRAAGKLLASF